MTKLTKVGPRKVGPDGSRKGIGGAPSKYKPEYCQQLIDHMREGLSFECFAANIGTTAKTLWDWSNAHEEFGRAKKEGLDLCRKWWEQLATISAADDVDALIAHTGMKPFLKKRTTKTRTLQNGNTEVDVTDEYHVPRPSTGLIVFNLVNRFRHTDDPWINAQSHEHTGKDGGPIQTEGKTKHIPAFDTSGFTDEDLRAFNRLLKAATVPAA